MSKKKKYTFEDWKAGGIEQDYVNKKIEGFDDQRLYGVGYLPEQLREQGFITDEENSKIEKAQKEIFHTSVENAYKSFLNQFTDRLEDAYKPVELIKNRIEKLQSEIDDASNYIKDQIYSGEWSKVGIGHKAYEMVSNPDGMGWTYLHNTLKTPAHNTRTTNHVFVKMVSLHQKDNLEDLLKTKYSGNTEKPGEDAKTVRKTAEKIKLNSKNPNSPYTVDHYIFVMNIAKDNPSENNVANLVRTIRQHPKCPKILSNKGLDDTTKPERNWIAKIDAALGIKRKLNTES